MDYNIIEGKGSVARQDYLGVYAYVGNIGVNITSYKDGAMYLIKADITGSIDLYLNLNGLGYKVIKAYMGGDPTITAGFWTLVVYDITTDRFYTIGLS